MTTAEDLTIDEATHAQVVDRLCEKLVATYVFPEVGAKMAEHLRTRMEAGDYRTLTTASAFCEILTEDMREISNDLHLRAVFSVEPRPIYTEEDLFDNPERLEEYRREAQLRNFGFRRVERLAGNIGYIDLIALDAARFAAETAVAALTFVAHTDALIFDLRDNGGGDPLTVAFIQSYLFDGPRPTHLNSFYWRPDDEFVQFWTHAWVPGHRYGSSKPVYALTSKRTFSGGEEFAYNLRQTGRGTLIGETTGGGANPVQRVQLTPHFEASIAAGRAINPISKTNWEGTGVEPHIPVPAEDALRVAHREALNAVLERLGEPGTAAERAQAAEARATLDTLGNRE